MRDGVVQVAVDVELSRRDVTVLRRCFQERVTLVNSDVPAMVVDGMPYCDQHGALRLIELGLLRCDHVVPVGQQVAAVLTLVGYAAFCLADAEP